MAKQKTKWTAPHYAMLVLFGLSCLLLLAVLLATPPQRLAQSARASPAFALAPIEGLGAPLTPAMLRRGEWSIVNVWASWCAPCRLEHPLLLQLHDEGVAVYGINYKDEADDARQFLRALGNPYRALGADADGRAALAFGIYGIPETFVLDGEGIIRAHMQGAVSEAFLEEELRPLLAQSPTR